MSAPGKKHKTSTTRNANACNGGSESRLTAAAAATNTNSFNLRPLGATSGTGTVPKAHAAAALNRLNITMQELVDYKQQEQQKQQQQQQLKTTEMVQPLQRPTKAANAGFQLITPIITRPQQQQPQPQQQQLEANCNFNVGVSTQFDGFENLSEQTRYCFPVRPIQRVQHQPQDEQQHQQQQQQQQLALARPIRQQQLQPQAEYFNSLNNTATATVGVVVPTTPSSITHSSRSATTATNTGANTNRRSEEQLKTLLLRQYIDFALNNLDSADPRQDYLNMFNNATANVTTNAGAGPTSTESDFIVVNSTSLDSVPMSELSDNRAQSIQSLHSSAETPTPDTPTPTNDELEQRLACSAKSICEKEAYLLNLKQVVKSKLNELEELRATAPQLKAAGQRAAPNYNSIEEVQVDMSALVGRMKQLTAFMQNQQIEDDDNSADTLAEQQQLERKIEALRVQRDEMRSLVSELQKVNVQAAKSKKPAATASESDSVEREVTPARPVRAVPVENKATAAQIEQKTQDINALKTQLEYLKSMFRAVDAVEIGSAGRLPSAPADEQRMQQLNHMTTSIKAEADYLQRETDYICTLKAEIARRKQQAADAIQMGDEALKRSSLTPTPTPKPTTTDDYEQTRLEFDLRKQQFEELCQQLSAAKPAVDDEDDDDDDDNGDEVDELGNDSDFSCYNNNNNNDDNSKHEQQASATNLQRQASTSTVVDAATASMPKKPQQSSVSGAGYEDCGSAGDTASQQSGSKRSLFVPQPMPAFGGYTWPGLSTPSNYWQQLFCTLPTMPMPTAPPTAGTFAGSGAASTTGNDFGQQQQANSSHSTLPGPQPSFADSMLLQQFIQNQQMLMNSIYQCSQNQWQQQREINAINATLRVLEERLNHMLVSGVSNDLNYGMRAESVPTPLNISTAPYGSLNHRAQSEQPPPPPPPLRLADAGATLYMNFPAPNYAPPPMSYVENFRRYKKPATGEQQKQEPQQQQQQETPIIYNNQAPQLSHLIGGMPAPIFMHHHNNSIHQNNANLRTQNQHANNQQQQQQHAVGNLVAGQHSAAATTLNNQVPPGNRANNYWDNFRR